MKRRLIDIAVNPFRRMMISTGLGLMTVGLRGLRDGLVVFLGMLIVLYTAAAFIEGAPS